MPRKKKEKKTSKVRLFFRKVGKALFTWGKPIIRKELKEKLVPLLQKKINAGAKNIDKHVDALIKEAVDEFIDKYLK